MNFVSAEGVGAATAGTGAAVGFGAGAGYDTDSFDLSPLVRPEPAITAGDSGFGGGGVVPGPYV
jgi:hypothetical protein